MNEALAGDTLEQPSDTIDLDALFAANVFTQTIDADTEIADFDPEQLLDEPAELIDPAEQAALEARRAANAKLIAEMYIEHADAITRYLRRLTRNNDRAQDLLQDTFEKALRNAHNFTPGTNGAAWLHTIARNTFLDSTRRNKREAPSDYEIDPQLADRGRSVESLVVGREAAATTLRTMLASDNWRGPKMRSGVAYKKSLIVDWLGYSGQEAANILGIKPVTHRTRTQKALHIARECLDAEQIQSVIND